VRNASAIVFYAKPTREYSSTIRALLNGMAAKSVFELCMSAREAW
jgi:hypothetical protein